jgi:hypothetical protein
MCGCRHRRLGVTVVTKPLQEDNGDWGASLVQTIRYASCDAGDDDLMGRLLSSSVNLRPSPDLFLACHPLVTPVSLWDAEASEGLFLINSVDTTHCRLM